MLINGVFRYPLGVAKAHTGRQRQFNMVRILPSEVISLSL